MAVLDQDVVGADGAPEARAEAAAVKKAFSRLIPALMVVYVLAYVDRVNLGFAALTMNADLGLTATMFGFATACFFITYVAFEVPSNLLMVRFGARIWIPRIMITWGLVSAATAFVTSAWHLYGLRALLGLAEAGLFPGVLYYLSTWFPEAARARANSYFLTALPLALVLGAPISGLILQLDGMLGLAGWQWLFLIEGLPSVLVGIAAFALLTNRPAEVRWLTPEEQAALQRRLDLEARTIGPGVPQSGAWRELLTLKVAAFALANFCVLASMSVLGAWTPLIVKELLGATQVSLVAVLAALPPLVGMCAIVANGRHSDRTQERVWHTIGAMAVGAIGWLICIFAPRPALQLLGLAVTAGGVYATQVTYWALVMQHLSARTRAVGLAAIATLGTTAPIVTPILIGVIRDQTQSFALVMGFAASLLVLGVLALAVATRRTAARHI